MDAEVLIVGAGPAGMSAALQLKRSGIQTLLFEHDRVGGALLNADWVENYPPFSPGITGPELAARFQELMHHWGIEIQAAAIRNIQIQDNHFLSETSSGLFATRAVMVASGCVAIPLQIPGAQALTGEKLFYEIRNVPTRFQNEGATACVLGGGDIAFDYALALSKRKCRVLLVLRSSQLRCLGLLETRVRATSNIEIITNFSVTKIERIGDQLSLSNDHHPTPLHCDFILAAIGRRPNTSFLPLEGFTQPPFDERFHFAGDVKNGSFRQVGIAVGDGLRCAMDIANILKK